MAGQPDDNNPRSIRRGRKFEGYGYGREGSSQLDKIDPDAGGAEYGYGRTGRNGNDDAQTEQPIQDVHQDDASGVGRGSLNYLRSDARIRQDVCDGLASDSVVDASGIEVQVSNGGEVTLAGSVRSSDEGRRAEQCAKSVTGVKHVQNNIRIGSDETLV